MGFTLITTVGPSLFEAERLRAIDALGDCVYRINGAHCDAALARTNIEQVRRVLPQAKILIDLPGNKVRTANLEDPIPLARGATFTLRRDQLNFPGFLTFVHPGDRMLANDSIYTLEVVEVAGDAVLIRSHSDGLLASNKGLHVAGVSDVIPFLFDRDRALIRVASEEHIEYLGLSYVRSGEDIRAVKECLGPSRIHLIAKVETAAAMANLFSIFREVRSVLIDRGDLSSTIGILNVAAAQASVIEAARRVGVDVYLATQFLKNMERYPVPLIAEVIDLCNTVRSGIVGLQLSEETAIGKYPVECAALVFDAYQHSFRHAYHDASSTLSMTSRV